MRRNTCETSAEYPGGDRRRRARCMHFALLIGYGAGADQPVPGALETIVEGMNGTLRGAGHQLATSLSEKAVANLHQGRRQGRPQDDAKMGISTLRRATEGAQIFEADRAGAARHRQVLHGHRQRVLGGVRTWRTHRRGGWRATRTPIPEATPAEAHRRPELRRGVPVAPRRARTTCSTPRRCSALQHATRTRPATTCSGSTPADRRPVLAA
jgi:hypothetical protein